MVHQPRTTDTALYDRAFLLSINTPATHPLRLRGAATGFDEALRFFEQVIRGRIDANLPGRLLTYFSAAPKNVTAHQFEQTGFGAQFTLPGPKQGLNGFLEKNEAPFTNQPHQIEAAQRVVSWLKSKIR
ncbi:hypothetical protein [Acanthopleuribacter pedis]|uniref:Uncharacterized protein n=1 Tax=Acanthopleuribacter pedis TaxID=442870 RepID=A0A8J7Q7V5_9BACT|nr:hypothetical protein [Acanthopleuribacter pedis]MBO1320011.1 hypothetical protein [Acanthopleuribacter pedis]